MQHTGPDVGWGLYVLCNWTATAKWVVFDSSSPLKVYSSPCPPCPCCQNVLQDFLNSYYLDSRLQIEPKVRDKILGDIKKFYKNTWDEERTKHWHKTLSSSSFSASPAMRPVPSTHELELHLVPGLLCLHDTGFCAVHSHLPTDQIWQTRARFNKQRKPNDRLQSQGWRAVSIQGLAGGGHLPAPGPSPDPPRAQEPAPCGNESGCPTQLWMHEPCTNTAFPGSELQLQRKKYALPSFKSSPQTFGPPWSPLQPHHADAKRANYHTKRTLSAHSKTRVSFYLERFSFCAIVKSSVERGKREREKDREINRGKKGEERRGEKQKRGKTERNTEGRKEKEGKKTASRWLLNQGIWEISKISRWLLVLQTW